MAKLETTRGETKIELREGSFLDEDVLYGADGIDFLFGFNKDDMLFGKGGEDRLFGGSGDDVLEGGEGGDYLDGGANTDTASYARASSGITVSLDTGTGSRGDALDDKLVDIENVTGSEHDDYIYGNHLGNVLKGLGGEDELYGYGGNDWLYGGIHGDTLDGGFGDDHLFGGSGLDTLWGGQDNDVLDGGLGSDTAYGEQGNDRFIGDHREADTFIGGSGTDTVDYRYTDVASWEETDMIYLGSLSLGGEGLGGDTLIEIENVVGTVGRDWIQGSTHAKNVLHGWDGDDKLFGFGGHDDLYGDKGNDTFFLSWTDPYVIEVSENPYDWTTIYRIDGGEGVDTLDLSSMDSLASDLSIGNIFNLHDGGTIGLVAQVFSIENLIGSNRSEHIDGSDADNEINGRGGADYIDGGFGSDILTGGASTDYFIFTQVGDVQHDVITDFTPGEDRIRFGEEIPFGSYGDLLDTRDGDGMEQVGNDVVITMTSKETITLLNVDKADLSSGDFDWI